MNTNDLNELYYSNCCDYIDKYGLGAINDTHLKKYSAPCWTDRELEIILQQAVNIGRLNTVKHILDYLNVPDAAMTLKERISYFTLTVNL